MVLLSNASCIRPGGQTFQSCVHLGLQLSLFIFRGLQLSFLQTDHLTRGQLSGNKNHITLSSCQFFSQRFLLSWANQSGLTFITHNTDQFEQCNLNRSPSATLELDFSQVQHTQQYLHFGLSCGQTTCLSCTNSHFSHKILSFSMISFSWKR